MTKTAFCRMLLLLAATGATGCRCSGDAGSQGDSSQFRALPPDSCTANDIPGCTAACDQGAVQACTMLGFIYLQREHRDFVKAEAANKKACEGGIQQACIRVAESILGLEGRRSEWPAAVAVYKSACEQDEPYGCYNLGKLHEAGKMMPADKAKAIELYKKACKGEQGYIGACVRLWVAEGHAMPWKSRKGMTITCMEELGNCPPEKQ